MSAESVLDKIRQQLKLLNAFTENSYESDECLKTLKTIDKSYDDRSNRIQIADLLAEQNYPAICINLLKYYHMKNIFQSDKVWFCTYYLLHAMWNFSDVSRHMSIELSETGFIPILLSLIANPEILDSCDENEEQLLKMSINILHNVAQQPETKVTFREHRGSELIKQFSLINHEQLKVLAFLCLAHILNEDELRETDSAVVIKYLTSNLRESYKKDDHKFKGIASREYLAGLTKLAVNRDNKFKMIDCGLLSILKEVLKYDNPLEEQRHSLTCVWNLCFEDKIRDVLKKDKEFLTVLNNLSDNTPSDELRKICGGIFYTINELPKKTDAKVLAQQNRKNHIMISYNSGSRDICVKLKDKLKNDGFKVWIDVEQIQGSALQSMADAVENSAVILICITEKYYQSPNCRLEAEYAVRLNKPIIPLLMQNKYSPQGWLGISIGSKIYYNFATYAVEEKYPSLVKEVRSYYTITDDQTTIVAHEKPEKSPSPRKILTPPPRQNLTKVIESVVPTSASAGNIIISNITIPIIDRQTKSKQIPNWTTKDVKDWINKLNLATLDIGSFDDVDGPCIVELYEMKNKAPEFFFNLLKEKLSTWRKLSSGDWERHYKLSDLLKLSNELSNLFKSSI